MQYSYQKLNNILGVIVFILSSICYLLTIEPNISFWDTGEYIASAAKLEVTHSPGAALFQLIGAVFSGLAFGDGSKYPILINSMNAIISGLTIMLTFWATSYFMLKIVAQNADFNKENTASKVQIFGAALIGSLIFAFSDTFWYSAVEGEVYAMASFFIALLIWLASKYDRETDTSYENRWLILISLVIGLSVGVHMMVLLAVPAVCFIYFQKNYEYNLKNFLIANGVTLLVLAFTFMFIFPFIMSFFGETEIFFVNELGLPFNSGLFVALILLAAIFYFANKLTRKYNKPVINSIFWSVFFMLIGFSCWMMIPIRANANPPMNLNNPDNALGMKDYYNREQYGEWPTFYGAYYTAYLDQGGITKAVNTSPIYLKNETTGKYDIVGHHFRYEFNDEHVGLFPRMYYPQNDTGVQENYGMYWGYPEIKIKGEFAGEPQIENLVADLKKAQESGDISISDYSKYNEYIDILPPTLGQNIGYFMDFQVGDMFVRYLLWNFVGKQNDKEWHGDSYKGNWEDGIVRNSKRDLPEQYTNKGTNHYFFLPLILGLIGLFYQLNRDFGRFYALLSLFLLAGIGIILYTNVKPWEPRERDYALVGSFYVFAMWAGLGAGAILEFLYFKVKKAQALSVGVALLAVIPTLMAFQNWDDHDRSHRHTAYDEAYSYLNSLGDDAILFVYGDNDTYPLWGVQETEGLRNDVKVINYTLLGTSWYIKQTHRKTYEADKLPHSLQYNQYREGVNDMVILFDAKNWNSVLNEYDEFWQYVSSEAGYNKSEFESYNQYITQDSMTAKEAMEYIKKPTERRKKFVTLVSKYLYQNNQESYDEYNLLPVSKIVIPVNKENCLKYGIVRPEDADKMQDYITLELKGGSLRKAELAMLDMLANYNWDRPLYISSGGIMDPASTFYMNEFTEFQGFSYKVVPIKTPRTEDGEYGRVNAHNIYKIVKGFRWGNFKDPKGHFDEAGLNNIINYRRSAGRGAKALAEANENAKAIEILDLCMQEIPIERYPGTPSVDAIIYGYIRAGAEDKGLQLAQTYQNQLMDEYSFYEQMPPLEQQRKAYEIQKLVSYYAFSAQSVAQAYIDLGKEEKAKIYSDKVLKIWYDKFDSIIKTVEEGGDAALKQNDGNLQSIIRAFRTLTSTFAEVDSVYVMEKQLEMEMRMSKLENASGGF